MGASTEAHPKKLPEKDVACDEIVEVVELPSQESIRDIVETCFADAKCRLERLRTEKIRGNVAKAALDDNDEMLTDQNGLAPSGSVLRDVAESSRKPGISACAEALFAIPPLRKQCQFEKSDIPPPGVAWVRTQTNVAVPEKYEHDFHVPYLGESEAMIESSNTLAMDLFQQELDDEGNDSEIEEFNYNIYEVNEAPVDAVENVRQNGEISTRKELRSSSRRAEVSPPKTSTKIIPKHMLKQAMPVWDRAAKRVALADIMDRLGTKDTESIETVVTDVFQLEDSSMVKSYQANVLTRKKLWKAQDDENQEKKGMHLDVVKHARREVTTRPSDVLKSESITFFVCRQCYTYVCSLHGYQNDARPVKKPFDKSRKEVLGKEGAAEIEAKCEDRLSNDCWLSDLNEDEDAKWVVQIVEDHSLWKDTEAVVRELHETFGHDPCRITAMVRAFFPEASPKLRITCSRIALLCRQLFSPTSHESKAPPIRGKKRQGKWTISRARRPAQEIESMQGGKRLDYVPCRHEGACTMKNCICMQSGLLCEKFCGCNHTHVQNGKPLYTCSNAYRGCACKAASACGSKACFCFSMNRECDPDLCRQCHECRETPLPNGKKWTCINEGLRMNEKQKVVVGHSKVHGWGAFAVSDIAKGEIIGEYVGELIKQEEAERRGRVYDKINYSFLFNTTQDYALDSTRLGNKLRYCNHSSRPNCEPKVMRVGGDVRVGLYAKRSIAKNEELFFNYGYDDGPAWAMQGCDKRNSTSKKKTAKQESSSDFESDEILPAPSRKRRFVEDDDDDDDRDSLLVVPNLENGRQKGSLIKDRTSPKLKQRIETKKADVEMRDSSISSLPTRKSAENSVSPDHSNSGKTTPQRGSVWRGVLRRVSAGAAAIAQTSTIEHRENDDSHSNAKQVWNSEENQKLLGSMSRPDNDKQAQRQTLFKNLNTKPTDESMNRDIHRRASLDKQSLRGLDGYEDSLSDHTPEESARQHASLDSFPTTDPHVSKKKRKTDSLGLEHDNAGLMVHPHDFDAKSAPSSRPNAGTLGSFAHSEETSSLDQRRIDGWRPVDEIAKLASRGDGSKGEGDGPKHMKADTKTQTSSVGPKKHELEKVNLASRKRGRSSDGEGDGPGGSSVARWLQTTLTTAKRRRLLTAEKPASSWVNIADGDKPKLKQDPELPKANRLVKLLRRRDSIHMTKPLRAGQPSASNPPQESTSSPELYSPTKGVSLHERLKPTRRNGTIDTSDDDKTDEAVPVVNLVSDEDEANARGGTNENNFRSWFI